MEGKFGYIYLTTNLINGKIYIGKRQKSTFDQNYYGSGTVLEQALIKYGKENFKREILDWAYSLEELNEKECYWIKKYNAKNKKIGYNRAKSSRIIFSRYKQILSADNMTAWIKIHENCKKGECL